MSDRAYAKVQVQQKTLSGSSPKSSLLQRTCTCGQHTIAGAECSACRNEQSMLHRSQRAFGPPSAPTAVQGNSPAQENGTSFNSAFDRASRFGHDFSRIPIHSPAARVIQTKLAINKPGDQYEQEADRLSQQVMRMPEPQLQRACACGGGCPKCQAEQPGREHERLQTKRVQASDTGQIAAPPIVHEVLRSPGQPLDPATRAFMEPHFGHDFSRVRIHTDAKAAESAWAIQANAYTSGQNMVFGAGQYAPTTPRGKSLLAHELAHVVQQGGARSVIQRQACPNRPANEVTQSRTPAGILPSNVEFNLAANQLDIVDFAINSKNLPPNVTNNPDWQRAMSLMAGDPSIRVAVTGFTDCVGSNAENLSLRQERVQTVIAAMPATVRAKILFSFTVSTTNFIDTNTTAEGRARNRSVRVTFASVPPSKQESCDMLQHAHNLDEYLFLVRCLETRLGLTAASDTRTALSVLRQIYYGSAAWSASRNPVWNMVITNQPWAPGTDPTAALHPPLMSALQHSQVVEGTDIGHILTGIDAMLTPQNVTITKGPFGLQTNLANEEWATWAGDVGSAAAEWALDAFLTKPNNANLDPFFHRFASDADLIGDIDSFAVRAGFSGAAPPAQLMQAIQLTGPLSNALLQYFRITSSALSVARGRRTQNLIEAYGGIIASRKLTNRAALIARLRPSVDEFARLFSIQRLLTTSGPQPPPGAPPFPTLLATAIDEMTARFVDWLVAQL
jgi:outer membrane protein OmpA-like peptidoglycan-associated protein